MSEPLNRKAIGEGIHLSSVIDRKFKRNRISVSFILPLGRETASLNAVVPHILRMDCREYPDLTSLAARLCDLYGAVLDADVTKYGGYQVLEVAVQGLGNRFALENEDIVQQCARLLAGIVLDPKLDGNGLFCEQETALQRQYVLDTIDAEINDKRSYALSRCLQVMCADEPVAVRRYGERASAEAVTPAAATGAYRNMLETAPVEIIFTGCGNPAGAEKIFSDRFAAARRAVAPLQPVDLRPYADQVREHTETMAISQGKLVMGLRTGEYPDKRRISAARVMTAALGGTPFSRLFLNVREKLSLCYYCAARFDVSTRLMMIDSGVDSANKQKAQDEILAQLASLQQDGIGGEELRNTKLLIKNSITSTNDSLASIEGWYLAQILRGQSDSPEEDAALIDEITAEEVRAAARAVTLDTVYFLTADGQGKEEA